MNAARITDIEVCPVGKGGPIVTGAGRVLIEGRPAARIGDTLTCGGGTTRIESGSPTVLIEGSKAARIGDTTCHGGVISTGATRTFIGNSGASRVATVDRASRVAAPFVKA